MEAKGGHIFCHRFCFPPLVIGILNYPLLLAFDRSPRVKKAVESRCCKLYSAATMSKPKTTIGKSVVFFEREKIFQSVRHGRGNAAREKRDLNLCSISNVKTILKIRANRVSMTERRETGGVYCLKIAGRNNTDEEHIAINIATNRIKNDRRKAFWQSQRTKGFKSFKGIKSIRG